MRSGIKVYTSAGAIPIEDWNGEGTVSFSKRKKPVWNFVGGIAQNHSVRGLHWTQIYCLVHLGIDSARYDSDSDSWVWRSLYDETFLPKYTIIPNSSVVAYVSDN